MNYIFYVVYWLVILYEICQGIVNRIGQVEALD